MSLRCKYVHINDTRNPFFSYSSIKHKSSDQLNEMENSNSITFVDSYCLNKIFEMIHVLSSKKCSEDLIRKMFTSSRFKQSFQVNAMTTS